MNKVLYWLSARPLFALIGKGYAALRKALDNIPGFDAFSNLATLVTDRIFAWVKFPDAIEARFEPYIEFQRGRQMDRALVFALLVYMALLGAYPSRLGHLDTAPQIWIALPIVSGFNPYLGLVSGLIFSVADWIGKFLPFESVYGADFGGGFQNFWGARIGYILAYTTMILNGMLPGILARVFRQFVRGIAHKILPRKATQAAMGLLMLLVAGTLLYQIGGPRALYAMSAFSLMGFALAVGPPPPGQGSPCMSCGAMLPPGQHQCMACGGLTQEGQQYIEHKRHMEEQARLHAQQQQQQQGQPPPGPGTPPMAAAPPGGEDYLYEALATIGSMLGATVGIVASHEWAQRVGNYGAFYALRADPDVSCRDLSAGNYGDLQARSPVPGAVGGAMPPGAAGAVSPAGTAAPGPAGTPNDWKEQLGEGKPGDSQSAYVPTEDGSLVSRGFIYDPAAGGWREASAGEPDGHGQVWDPNAGVWQSAAGVEWDNRVRRENQEMLDRERAKIDQRRIEAEQKMKEAQARRERMAALEKKAALQKDLDKKRAEIAKLQEAADKARAEAGWWEKATSVVEGVKFLADTGVNILSSSTGPAGQLFGKAYSVVSGAAEGAATSGISGAVTGAAEGATTAFLGDKLGKWMSGGTKYLKSAYKGVKPWVKGITAPVRAFTTGVKRGLSSGLNKAFERGVTGSFESVFHPVINAQWGNVKNILPLTKQVLGNAIKKGWQGAVSGEIGATTSSTIWNSEWSKGSVSNPRWSNHAEAVKAWLPW